MVGVVRRLRMFWPWPGTSVPGDAAPSPDRVADARTDWLPWKRLMDIVLGGGTLLLMLPIMLLIGVAIALDSGRPILFRQMRIGRDGKPFVMYKFRSMRCDSNDDVHRAAAAAWFAGTPAPFGYKLREDRRITRVGRLLRATSLDELPQLFNVLRGDMSLVGPRPAIPYELSLYEESFFERQTVRPGITGLWQVMGRDRVAAAEMMLLDRRYIKECSPGLDLKILLLTFPAVLGLTVRNL